MFQINMRCLHSNNQKRAGAMAMHRRIPGIRRQAELTTTATVYHTWTRNTYIQSELPVPLLKAAVNRVVHRSTFDTDECEHISVDQLIYWNHAYASMLSILLIFKYVHPCLQWDYRYAIGKSVKRFNFGLNIHDQDLKHLLIKSVPVMHIIQIHIKWKTAAILHWSSA